jgi:hypothetical protein
MIPQESGKNGRWPLQNDASADIMPGHVPAFAPVSLSLS